MKKRGGDFALIRRKSFQAAGEPGWSGIERNIHIFSKLYGKSDSTVSNSHS